MPDGVGGPEILQFKSPRAGNKGGKAQTEEEKAKDEQEKQKAVEEKAKEFEMRILYPQKEVIDEATESQQQKIKSFQNKAKDNPISNWNIKELREATTEMLDLDDELVRSDVDTELQNLARDLAGYCFIELVKRPEFEPLQMPDSVRKHIREMQAAPPPEILAQKTPVAVDVLKAIKDTQKGGKKVTPQEARELWTQYYEDQGKNIKTLPGDERQTLELAIAQGIAPEYHREPERVLSNAAISDSQARIKEAKLLLNMDFTPEQKDALMRAHEVGWDELGKDGKPAGIYNYTQKQTAKRTRILAEAFTPEQRRKLMESALAGVPISIADTAPPELRRIADEINRRPEIGRDDREISSGYLQDQVRRVRDIIDRGTLTDPGVAQALDFITTLEERTEVVRQTEQILAESRAEAERRRREQRIGRNEMPDDQKYLKKGTLSNEKEGYFDLELNTYTGRVSDIANKLSGELDKSNDQLGTETSVNNERLNDYIERLSPLAGGADEEATQAQKLLAKTQWLKEALRSQMDTYLSIVNPGLYGEIRMDIEKQEILINNILDANPDAKKGEKGWDEWMEVEKEFNKLFKYADVDSNHEWKDAIGPGGDMEIRDFQNLLARAADNKTLPLGRPLTSEEQKRVQRVARILNQEQTVREYLHTITYYVNKNFGAEDIIKAASRFAGEEAQVAFSKRGTAPILRMYEQAMLEVVTKNGGYLPANAMINNPNGTYGDVEQLVLNMAERAKAIGVLPEDIEDWEIKRAVSLARGMGIVTARFFEIAAMHGIVKNIPLNSFWANGLVKNIAFFQQVARFNVGQAQNAILGYKLEGNSGPWSTGELKKYKAMSQQEIFDSLVNDHEDNRLIQMKNPFHIGSIFTQTGWRWKGDKVNLASATAELLQYDKDNPLIGVGLLIEAKRGDLVDNNRKKAQEAEQVIRDAISLATETSPLKLFNNLISLRQGVLRKYYGEVNVNGKKKPLRDSGDIEYIKEDSDSPGQIIIQSKELQNDITALALVQENLLSRRVAEHKKYLDSMKIYEERLAREEVTEKDKPKLDLPKDLKFEILKNGDDPGQETRVRAFAKHIQDEFKANGNRSHQEKLMYNLKNKGWKVPWVFGTDDIPHEAFNYAAITGDTIKRRWDADIGPVVATAGLYGEFISNLTEFQSQADIVKAMKKIHSTLSSHDASVANDTMRYLTEGVAKFYKKDWTTRLPLGIGKLEGFVGGQSSYAQVAFGRGQMAWDELDIQGFLQQIHASGLVDDNQLEELKKRLGAENYQLAWAMMRSGIPMLFAAFIYMMLIEQVEQAKKAT